MSFIEIFKDKFYFVGCDIKREIRNHREVKVVTFPKEVLEKVANESKCASDISLNVSSWIDEYNAYALHTKSYVVLTGKISGITVLDFDTLYAYKAFCKNVPDFESYFTVKTKKGFHVYCLYNPNLKSCNNILKNLIKVIDIRNDPVITKCGLLLGIGVLCPPSSYNTLDGKCYTYEFLGGTIKPVPEYLFRCLKILKAHTRTNEDIINSLNFWPQHRIENYYESSSSSSGGGGGGST
jgi:hypothetical protein